MTCCSKKSDEAAPASKPIVAPTEADLGSNSGAVAALHKNDKELVPTTDVRQLVGDLGNEAQNRPRAGILAEPLFDALEQKANIHLSSRTQYMGATMRASFCAGGRSTDATLQRLTVSMCEYTDDKAAVASLDFMNQRFPVKGARREEHHAAVLTVVSLDAKADPRVDQAFKVFESL